MKRKKILTDSLIILLVTILMLAVLEVILRVTFPELKKYRKTPAHALAYEFNKDYLVALKPNVVKEFRIRKGEPDFGKVVTWRTNSQGFRGPEIGEKKGLRIIVYGDSNVQARFSDYQDTYPAVLQSLLRKKIKDVQVINAGIVGEGPDQHLLRLKHDLATVKPDIVVFHIFADNDYGDIIRNRLFKLSAEGELVKTNFPAEIDQKLNKVGSIIGYHLRGLYIQGLVNYVVTKRKELQQAKMSKQEKKKQLITLLEHKSSAEYEIYKKNLQRKYSHFGDHYDIDIASDPDSESAQTKIALMKKIILSAKQICDENSIKFLVVVQPSMIDLLSSSGYIDYVDLKKRFKKYKSTNLTDPLKQLCLEQQLNCVHLIDSYRQNHPETLYRNDGHWNTRGQYIAAQETLLGIMDNSVYP